MIRIGSIDRYSSKEKVFNELVVKRGWTFLRRYSICTGEPIDNDIWWDSYTGGWKGIWNEFLLKVGTQVFEKIPQERPIFRPTDSRYKSTESFIYDFIVHRSLIGSSVREYSESLHTLDGYDVEDIFEITKLSESNKRPNPNMPSALYYIEPNDFYKNTILGLNDFWYSTQSARESLKIFDTKSKYGTLRVEFNGYTSDLNKLCSELNHVSEYTCERCGKQPKNSRGKHIIWKSSAGYWVSQYCKECAKKECYDDRCADYKDTLITHHNVGDNGKSIKVMMDERWERICDNNKVTIKSFSKDSSKVESWNPWRDYDVL